MKKLSLIDSKISTALVPQTIHSAGAKASKRFIEFFTANIRNKGTRAAYHHAVVGFFEWCDRLGIGLLDIEPITIATYIELRCSQVAAPTVKVHLAAIKSLFDYLVIGQIVPCNPAAAVRGPKHSVKKGKTPVLDAEEASRLINSIDTSTIMGLRDRAVIGVMVYSFARVSATINMSVEDYFPQGRRMWFRLHEKGGKLHEVPAHHKAEEYLDAYINTGGFAGEKKEPLFRSINKKKQLSSKRMSRTDVLRMVKRRALAAGVSTRVCCHSWRATGITAYLLNGGQLEHAMRIACHESARTTKLYDRTNDEVSLDEIERIRI